MSKIEITGDVGPKNVGDGVEGVPFRQDNTGALVQSGIHGAYYENILRGYGFVYSQATAGAVPVAPTTTNAPCVWNPSDSQRNLVILKVVAGALATGTAAAGHLLYATLAGCGATTGTANQIVSGTFVAAVNLLVGSGRVSRMRFAPATIATTGTPGIIGSTGWGQATAATTVVVPYIFTDLVDGMIIIPPGNTFQVCASGAVAGTWCISIFGLELPIALTA